ncbi:MAG: hypothetical protein IIB19_01875 [Chloroflexi bacterium]|nr:hypothetical protein [Chloroflexota bacterium]
MQHKSAQVDNVLSAVQRLDGWLERNDWKAYDPFDGLNARWPGPLARSNRYLRIALQQLVKRSPVNLRPLLGIRPATSSKGMGFLAKGYLSLYQTSGEDAYLRKSRRCLDWLTENFSRGYSGYAWGNHFDYQSRVFQLPKGVPTVVWTAHIAHAFFDSFETTGDEEHLAVALSACTFIRQDLSRTEDGDTVCISYIPIGSHQVHNANALAGSALARAYKHTDDEAIQRLAARSLAYTVKHQRQDGSWFYGEDRTLHWVDNFHTGYVLDSLLIYQQSTGDETFSEALRRGFSYYKHNFFLDGGVAKYYDTKTYPIDIQCCAQSIETLTLFSEIDPEALPLAWSIAAWTIEHMQDAGGYFYFQRHPRRTIKIPMFHWGQATMLSALAGLLQREQEGTDQTWVAEPQREGSLTHGG